ncbi:iron response transcriptional regulator IrrA [Roseibium marinum]|uniref:Ferric uptake regulation protein n=1 Tax=Roseibium marinum TaxID=281252 RepID=A0A2S3V209_9HYPH|nr:Fur family transcriptional regulator [Roseibium marinum]POF33823.1 Fur family iron response transcriptional regulator [Roseibium marinum]
MSDLSTPHYPPSSQQASLKAILRMNGLRATRQRLALGELLFTGKHQHINADELHQKAIAANANLTLATVYNTLHQFSRAGLLREVTMDATSNYFDTDTSDHHHFFVEDDKQVLDIPTGSVCLERDLELPEGMEVTHIDVIVRLRKIKP